MGRTPEQVQADAALTAVMPEGRPVGKGWDFDEGYGGYLIGESIQAQDRAYIAAMHPVVALALADLLDAHAGDWDYSEGDCCGPEDECFECSRNDAVLRFVRAINGAS